MAVSELERMGVHFPLGAPLGERGADGEPGTPFGLRYTVEPAETVMLDWTRIGYDEQRQIAVVAEEDGTLLPALRHTSTKTKTSSNADDRNPPDDDEDATGT